MYVRVMPGEKFSKDTHLYDPPRSYMSVLPMSLEPRQLRYIMPIMSSDAWKVYCVLLWYEGVKFEQATPTLGQIYHEYFELCMCEDDFASAIDELLHLRVQDEAMNTVQNLVSWETEETTEPEGEEMYV